MADYNNQVQEEIEKLTTCPYNNAHTVLKHRFAKHLEKCRRSYKGDDIVSCPFNASHRFPKPELDYHTENCTDKIFLEIQLEKFQNAEIKRSREDDDGEIEEDGTIKRRTHSTSSSGKNRVRSIVQVEDWDDCYSPPPNIKKRIEESNLITHFQHATKSKREELRIERHRQVVEMEAKKNNSLIEISDSESPKSLFNYQATNERCSSRSSSVYSNNSNKWEPIYVSSSSVEDERHKIENRGRDSNRYRSHSRGSSGFYERQRTISRDSNHSTRQRDENSYKNVDPQNSNLNPQDWIESSSLNQEEEFNVGASTSGLQTSRSRSSSTESNEKRQNTPLDIDQFQKEKDIDEVQKKLLMMSKKSSNMDIEPLITNLNASTESLKDNFTKIPQVISKPTFDDWDDNYVVPIRKKAKIDQNSSKSLQDPQNKSSSSFSNSRENLSSSGNISNPHLSPQSKSPNTQRSNFNRFDSRESLSSDGKVSKFFQDPQNKSLSTQGSIYNRSHSRESLSSSENDSNPHLDPQKKSYSAQRSNFNRSDSRESLLSEKQFSKSNLDPQNKSLNTQRSNYNQTESRESLSSGENLSKAHLDPQNKFPSDQRSNLARTYSKQSLSSGGIISSDENSTKNYSKSHQDPQNKSSQSPYSRSSSQNNSKVILTNKNHQKAHPGTLRYESQSNSSTTNSFNPEDHKNRNPMDYYDEKPSNRYGSFQPVKKFNRKYSRESSVDSFKTAKSHFSSTNSIRSTVTYEEWE